MIVCVPVGMDGAIAPGWGRAARVAVGNVEAGAVVRWDEVDVGWDRLHDAGTEGSHHARIARFLRDNGVELVLANHMGQGMLDMLGQMRIEVRLGMAGDARQAVAAVGA